MAGTTLDISSFIQPDKLGTAVAEQFITWENLRQKKKDDWKEVQQYIFQTDTTQTTNASTPWRNTTTVPKLTQIRDNLFANYLATMFPRRKWLTWEGNNKEDATQNKRKAIVNYMSWVIDRPEFRGPITQMILDYIDYGNAIGTVGWLDQRINLPDRSQTGYVGPIPVRVSPHDVVFNPTAASSAQSPKIVRSYLMLGELKKELESMTTTEDREELEALFRYLRDIRDFASTYDGALVSVDDSFAIAGFGSFKDYLLSNYVEVLTFYGDMYDYSTDEWLPNHKIMVVDRHKIVYKKPNPSFFGKPPIHHTGWRIRQDNLWAMGPLDNLVGMQYRIDHLENMKADIMDLTTFPVQKIKGYVEDYTWAPMAKIYCGDDGDVELLTPPVQALQLNLEIQELERRMEEMAGSPREAMGFRTPGEKTKYEVQRIENAGSRIFQNKVGQFEEHFLEPLLNDMLELARRRMSDVTIRFFDDEFNAQQFQDLTPQDIAGSGRIRPIAARHFAEQAEMVQNFNNFAMSPVYQDQAVSVHFSGIAIAKMMEELLDLGDYKLVTENIRISEQADTAKLSNVQEENVLMEAQTPGGIAPEDFDV